MPYEPKTFKPPTGPGRRHVPASRERAKRYGACDRLYGTARWKRRRKAWRDAHPLCVTCEAEGRAEDMYAVDHVVPHKGDIEAFWSGGLQSLCERHHNAKTAREDGGFGRQGRTA